MRVVLKGHYEVDTIEREEVTRVRIIVGKSTFYLTERGGDKLHIWTDGILAAYPHSSNVLCVKEET